MDDELDAMGPVDYFVVEFPGGRIADDVLRRLLELVDGGLVHILDLVVLRREQDGSVTALEVADIDGDGELDARVLEGAASGLLDADDVEQAAAVIGPGSLAAVVLYENLWALPFVTALRRSDAQLVAGGRVPIAALLDSLDAVEAAAPADA